MRFQTAGGQFVTAANRQAAQAMADQFGFGAIVGAAPAPAKATAAMSLASAHRIAAVAFDFPRHGEDWPATAREREADQVLRAAGVEMW